MFNKELLDEIEDEVKSIRGHQLRLAFVVEQLSHAYKNVFVEKYRDWGLPYEKTLGGITAMVLLAVPVIVPLYFAILVYKYRELLL